MYKIAKLFNSITSNKRKLLLCFFIFVVFIIITYILSNSIFIRPYREDYYYIQPRSWSEFMNGLLAYRYSWTGRYTTTTAFITVGLLNLWSLVPLISFSIFSLGLKFLYKKILMFLDIIKQQYINLLSILLAVVTSATVFFLVPHPYSSFFWASAAPIHVWSYGLMLILIALFLDSINYRSSKDRQVNAVYLSAGLLIVGTMSEFATTLAILTVATSIIWLLKNKQLTKQFSHWASPLISLLIAFIILLFSPGAQIRKQVSGFMSNYSELANLPYAVQKSTGQFFSMINNPTVLITLFLVFTIIFYIFIKSNKVHNHRKIQKIIGSSVIVASLVIVLNPALIFISTGSVNQLSRSQVPTVTAIVILVILSSIYVGILLRSLNRGVIVVFLLGCLLTFSTIISLVSTVNFSRDFKNDLYKRSIAYDSRQVILGTDKQDSKECVYYLTPIKLKYAQEGADLRADPNNWMNVGFAFYNNITQCKVIAK